MPLPGALAEDLLIGVSSSCTVADITRAGGVPGGHALPTRETFQAAGEAASLSVESHAKSAEPVCRPVRWYCLSRSSRSTRSRGAGSESLGLRVSVLKEALGRTGLPRSGTRSLINSKTPSSESNRCFRAGPGKLFSVVQVVLVSKAARPAVAPYRWYVEDKKMSSVVENRFGGGLSLVSAMIQAPTPEETGDTETRP